jgi:hypothetical protein
MVFAKPHRWQGEHFQGVLRSAFYGDIRGLTKLTRDSIWLPPTPYIVFHIQTKRERANRFRKAPRTR